LNQPVAFFFLERRRQKQELDEQNLSKVKRIYLLVENKIIFNLYLFQFKYPDLNDENAVQRFFMSEITLGEQLMGLGDIENGVEHLANAVAVTAHKENLLNVLRGTLPDPIFKMLVERLPEVSRKIYNSHKARAPDAFEPLVESSQMFVNESAKIVEITSENLAVDDCLD